jgi:hypothetical protein
MPVLFTSREPRGSLADGDSHVAAVPHQPRPIGLIFSASSVELAVRQSQRGQHTHSKFLDKTSDAGCVGYFGRGAIFSPIANSANVAVT